MRRVLAVVTPFISRRINGIDLARNGPGHLAKLKTAMRLSRRFHGGLGISDKRKEGLPRRCLTPPSSAPPHLLRAIAFVSRSTKSSELLPLFKGHTGAPRESSDLQM
ncbi:hypothetical protein KM043_006566 [Ampulex compressa]|nr:hypothetical protein KM043_006566 [Ampulex compressa]